MPLNRRVELSRVHTELNGDASAVRVDREWERRAHRRYAIVSSLNYRIVRQHQVLQEGSGRSVDISTSGISFESPHMLPLGSKVEVTIAWPSGPSALRRLEFVAEGRIVRTQQTVTAVVFKRYAFREIGRYSVMG